MTGMKYPTFDPYCAFKDDQSRLEALRSRDQRDKSIAAVKAVAFVVTGVALVLTGHADSVIAWLTGLGAFLGIRP